MARILHTLKFKLNNQPTSLLLSGAPAAVVYSRSVRAAELTIKSQRQNLFWQTGNYSACLEMWSTQRAGSFYLPRCHCDYFRALFKISLENDGRKKSF